MSDIILYGDIRSTFFRTARMAAEEKGVTYDIQSVELKSEAYRKIHPFGRMPAMRHGDFVLYETSAICRYIDAAFDGPALAPSEPRMRARMDQWISALNDYYQKHLLRGYVMQYVFPSGPDGQPDREAIEAGLEDVRYCIEVVDRQLAQSTWLAGEAFSIADMLLCPMFTYVHHMPEGENLFSGCENIKRTGRGCPKHC